MSLVTSNLNLTLESTDALVDVSLDLADREHFAVMGPSGAGKSTLLRVIAGLAHADSGSVEIDGTDVSDRAPHERPVGLMFQDYALFPHMTVRDNVAFGLRMEGRPKNERNRSADDMLELVGLGGYGDRHPQTLSGGEQQRVALARTLAPEPAVVLLDEPLGSLDQNLKDDLLHEMRRILSSVSAISIYVTHDRTEAEAFADRIAIMRSGRIVRVDEPAVIWRDPHTEFVARFIGHRNIADGAALGLPGRRIVVPPAAVSISNEGDRSGRVTECDFRDGAYRVGVSVGDTTLVTSTDTRLEIGSDVGIAIDASQVAELAVDEV